MLFLQRYNFTVVYRRGSSLHLADTLSIAPCQDEAATPSIPETFHVFHTHLAQLDPTSPALTDTTREPDMQHAQLPRHAAAGKLHPPWLATY